MKKLISGESQKFWGKSGTPTKILGNDGSSTDPQEGKVGGDLFYSSVEDAGIIGSLFNNPETTKFSGVARQPTKFLGGRRRNKRFTDPTGKGTRGGQSPRDEGGGPRRGILHPREDHGRNEYRLD